MIILEGKNLCERQKELNFKIKEAAVNKVDLQEVKAADGSDVDRIFKIGLASEYKNVDYIVEELTSGDPLYVSKALKCKWLYTRDYAHLINPDYLHHHIFPKMSLKMKKKTLSTISVHVRDETRAQLFYEYCINAKMNNNALAFLIFTSESFKNELMKDDKRFFDLHNQVNFKNLIGNSFALADTYGQRRMSILELPHLYSLNEEKYLDLFEKHGIIPYMGKVVGVKMSRSILKKHKHRVLKNPTLYLNVLNKGESVKYSSSGDAEVYAAALLPDQVSQFWNDNYYMTYKYILDLIKTASIYEFVKKIFTNKYGTSEFEMTKNFYNLKYYDLMNFEEREAWALKHLERQTDVIPEDENYKWYKFIRFAKSFKEIKAQIYITTNPGKRSGMLEILVESAKTQRDLEELFNYYYKRHVNETKNNKMNFVRRVSEHHKVLEFEDSCWVAFELILHSIDVYNSGYGGNDYFRTMSLIYHIINNKTLSEFLQTYLRVHISGHNLQRFFEQLNDEKRNLVYSFVNQSMTSIISEFEMQEYNDDVKNKVRPYLRKLEEMMRIFDKERNYPDIVLKFMKLDLENFEHIVGDKPVKEKKIEITEGYLFRCLKEDASLIVEKLPLIKEEFNHSSSFRVNMVLRRIKTYFSDDIAKQCTQFFTKTLYESLRDNAISEYRALYAMVFAIFKLGDETTKIELIERFAPATPKIEYDKIGYYVLYTQKAICRFQCYSRPPLPFSKTFLYMKGDYVHKCDDMLNMYLVNLPPALRTDFIKLLLDSPVSSQKRGIRLAFKIFEAADLKDIVSGAWKKTKNVSLRQNFYTLLLNKMVTAEGKIQEEMCELLKELTLTVHQDDADEVFDCFTNDQVPENLRGSYLQTVWKTVAAFPEKKSNVQRKTRVIQSLASNMHLIDEGYLVGLINDHVQRILFDQKLRPELHADIANLNAKMWDLTACYILDTPNEAKLEKSLKLVKLITEKCYDHWNEVNEKGGLIFQRFFRKFIGILQGNSSYFGTKYLKTVDIFEYLLKTFENKLGISKMYSYFWDWKLELIIRKAINGKTLSDKAACTSFGVQLGEFIKELKSKNLYYISFFEKIVGKILTILNYLKHCTDSSLLDQLDIFILVAHGLTHTEMFETYVLAIKLLPKDIPVKRSPVMECEYPEVLKKIKEQNDTELNTFMYDKFIDSDLKVRKVLL